MKAVTVVTHVEKWPAEDPWTDYYIGLHDFELQLYHHVPRVLDDPDPNPKENDMGFRRCCRSCDASACR